MAQRSLPYAGVRIVDFSRLLPGGWCSQFLADCGADVIKLEHPDGGDYARHNPPGFRHSGVYFNSVNRTKRSVTLDLRTPHSRPAVQRLLASADVVLESFRPGVPARLGVDYAVTVSCYQADEQGHACGRCDSCRLRRAGFIAAGTVDPTPYAAERPRVG